MPAAAGEVPDALAVAQQLFKDQPPGFPFQDFDLLELILPDGEDFGIRSDDDDEDEGEVETETGFGSVIGEWVVGVVVAGARACVCSPPAERQRGAAAIARPPFSPRTLSTHPQHSRRQPARRARGEVREAADGAEEDLRPDRPRARG